MARIGATLLAIAAMTTFSGAARATDPPIPQTTFTVSPGGVDLRSGLYVMDKVDLSIGDPARGGLEFKRTTRNMTASVNKLGQFSHNWMVYIKQKRVTNAQGMVIHMDLAPTSQGLSDSFIGDRSTGSQPFGINKISGDHYAELTMDSGTNPAVFTYTLSGGRKVVYRSITNQNEVPGGLGWSRSAYGATVSAPNGVVYTLNYDSAPNLKSVVSNGGFALVFEYTTVSTKTFVSKVCALNLAAQALPTNGLCPSGVPTVSYSYVTDATSYARLSSVTDVSGKVWTISHSTGPGAYQVQDKYYAPGQSTPYLTNVFDGDPSDQASPDGIVSKQTFADGHEYVYSWTTQAFGTDFPTITLFSTGFTENGSASTTVSYSYYYADGYSTQPIVSLGPETVTDPLGRTTSFYYCVSCGEQALYWKSLPQGMKVSYARNDGYFNVTGHTYTPNTGSSESAITDSSTFDCTSIIKCDKPSYLIDAKGNRTDFTYDSTHGGVLTQMGPPPTSGAARPLRVFTYSQKYAYILSGSTLVQASSPIWMPATATQCQTVAGSNTPTCDSSAPQEITTFEYGANGTANNLFVRGVAVTADSSTQRKCFSYDNRGNRISETLANAALSSCP